MPAKQHGYKFNMSRKGKFLEYAFGVLLPHVDVGIDLRKLSKLPLSLTKCFFNRTQGGLNAQVQHLPIRHGVSMTHCYSPLSAEDRAAIMLMRINH